MHYFRTVQLLESYYFYSEILNFSDNSRKICFIFNKGNVYQVLISFYSIIKNNPNEIFSFYFVIPPKTNLDLRRFAILLNPGSDIKVRYFKPEQATTHHLRTHRCYHNGIIAVKIWLKDILPEVHQILFLDSDTINVRPIGSEIWDINLKGKTIACTPRVKSMWINSGFIVYNLDELRKRPDVFKCANISSCFADDVWHIRCHRRTRKILPYRYNVEFGYMVNTTDSYQLNEVNHTIFYHLKDRTTHMFYKLSKSDLRLIRHANRSELVLQKMTDLYKYREEVDYLLQHHNRNIRCKKEYIFSNGYRFSCFSR